MFDELNVYKNQSHFFLRKDDSLKDICNAPKLASGIYLVYALQHGRVELVYIGSSGKVSQNGELQHRKGGLYDRIVNGKQFDDKRINSWPKQMQTDDIEALDVYWYETINNSVSHIPAFSEALIMQRYFELYGELPRWNKEF